MSYRSDVTGFWALLTHRSKELNREERQLKKQKVTQGQGHGQAAIFRKRAKELAMAKKRMSEF